MGHNLCEAGSHEEYALYGIAYDQSGLVGITNFSSNAQELKTMVHEFGHFYGAPDHYDIGSVPSSTEMNAMDGNYGFSRQCIYGEDKDTESVVNNVTICDGCRMKIGNNLSRYMHGS